ncbi:biotin--protein ligase [Lachnospiraceae bacterium KM106-2]|nr:biotin--protein ligase [Lachnospiraceae bacterium KM106-2]
MKERILEILKKSNTYVSGQEICKQLNVSRTAVWKVMNQLKEEGYEIEAISNKGYKIKKSPDSITDYELLSQINTKYIAKQIEYYEEIDSTNIRCKILAEEGAQDGILVVADQQTAGRGRRGRAWKSPKGSSIAMSLMLKPDIMPSNASMLTLVTAMALVKGINDAAGVDTKIKWPNDIILNNKKLCGILTEMSSELDYINYVVIGIGVNVNMTEFPEEISHIATSVAIELGHPAKRADIITKTMEAFEKYYDIFLKKQNLEDLVEEYNHQLIHKDREIRVLGSEEEYQAKALGIDKTGELMVELDDGTRKKIRSGEISVRGINGYV